MSGQPGYDAWLAGGDPGEAAAAEWEAFEKWADEHRPDLDWDDQPALDAAKAEWDAMVEQIEADAQDEIDSWQPTDPHGGDTECTETARVEGHCVNCYDMSGPVHDGTDLMRGRT